MLPFRDRSIDDVLASSLLEHFRDPYEVLDSIHRVLAPSASFTMRVPSPWSYSGILDTTHFFLPPVTAMPCTPSSGISARVKPIQTVVASSGV